MQDQIEEPTTLILVLADGSFIAGEADPLDRESVYDLMARAILGTAATYRSSSP